MVVEKNKVIELTYELWVDDGESEKVFFEKAEKDSPLVFLYGVGNLLDQFESHISGKKVGDSFEFTIDFENGYGDYDENKLVYLPQTAFSVDGKVDKSLLKVGTVIPMRDADGNHLQGEVVQVEPTRVQMDFNHPLAGLDLTFKGEIVNIRDAQPEEITHGHVHGAGGHHH